MLCQSKIVVAVMALNEHRSHGLVSSLQFIIIKLLLHQVAQAQSGALSQLGHSGVHSST